MDGWMDGRTDGRTDGWMDGLKITNPVHSLLSREFVPGGGILQHLNFSIQCNSSQSLLYKPAMYDHSGHILKPFSSSDFQTSCSKQSKGLPLKFLGLQHAACSMLCSFMPSER